MKNIMTAAFALHAICSLSNQGSAIFCHPVNAIRKSITTIPIRTRSNYRDKLDSLISFSHFHHSRRRVDKSSLKLLRHYPDCLSSTGRAQGDSTLQHHFHIRNNFTTNMHSVKLLIAIFCCSLTSKSMELLALIKSNFK